MKLFDLPETSNWRDVKGYEGFYQVSSEGIVARVGGKMLKPYRGQVYLSKGGKVSTVQVCNLVAEAFLPEYTEGQKVYHISGDSDSLSNLSLHLPETPSDSEWKDIPGYEGSYQASRKGEIRSINRVVNSSNDTKIFKPGKILSQQLTKDGYYHCSLMIEGKMKLHSVHRLVALTFIENPFNKPQVNHINGIKTDNRVENLEWVTASENMQHAKITGLWSPTECGNSARDKQGIPVRCITEGKEFDSISSAAKYYNMDFESVKESATLHRLRKGLQFEYITEE